MGCEGDVYDDLEDVALELCCSTREMSIGCDPFANHDAVRASLAIAHPGPIRFEGRSKWG